MDAILYYIRDNLVGTHYFIYAFILLFFMFAIIGYLFKQKYGKLDIILNTSQTDNRKKEADTKEKTATKEKTVKEEKKKVNKKEKQVKSNIEEKKNPVENKQEEPKQMVNTQVVLKPEEKPKEQLPQVQETAVKQPAVEQQVIQQVVEQPVAQPQTSTVEVKDTKVVAPNPSTLPNPGSESVNPVPMPNTMGAEIPATPVQKEIE